MKVLLFSIILFFAFLPKVSLDPHMKRKYSNIDFLSGKYDMESNSWNIKFDKNKRKEIYIYEGNSGIFIDGRDNKRYKWIRIGDQIWMTQNFAFKTEKGCYAYKNRWKRAEKEGYLYDWETARTIAPEGWHLPSREEYMIMLNFISNGEYHPRQTFEILEEGSYCIKFTKNGMYIKERDMYIKGIYPFKATSLWTSTNGLNFRQTDTLYTYIDIRYYNKLVGFKFDSKNVALSVRYVKTPR